MKFTNEEERYTALCAYVLGEAEPEERAAIEAELAGSAELRAQRDELEATIGLVQTSLGGEERLSDTTHDAVLRAAQARRPRWRVLRTPWLAAAAGLCAIAFGWYVLDGGGEGAIGGTPRPDQAVAKLERDGGERAKQSKDGLSDEASALDGFAAGRAGSSLSAVQGDADGHAAGLMAKAGERVEQRLGENELSREALRGLGYAGDDDASAPARPGAAREQRQFEDLDRSATLGKEPGAANDAFFVGRTTPEAQLGVDLEQVRSEPRVKDGPSEVVAVGGGAGGKLGNRGLGGGKRAAGGGGAAGSAPASPAGASTSSWEARPEARYAYSGKARGEPSSSAEEKAKELLAASGYVGEEKLGFKLPDQAPDQADGKVDERLARARIDRLNALGYDGGGADHGFTLRDDLGADFYAALSPEERERLVELECRQILERCRRRPNEQPSAMYFRYWGDNPFELTALDALSTFGVDVDTASYALVRNYLRNGTIPPREAVRTEEFVNYFAPDVPAPTEGTFAIKTELAPSRFGGDPSRWMLEVAVRGREVAREERKPLSLTFVVDTSGSMKSGDRIEMVKHALRLLLAELDGNDTVAIVAFSNEARLVLPATPASQRGLIESAIHPLAPSGGTNAEAGLLMGYEAALAGLRANANNRVVFLSDGVANVGQTDQDRITAEVARHRKQGIYLNTIGVGMGNHNDALLEQLANKGDGVCNYIDSPAEARRALVENFTGQFEPIARDVKVQVEFDPAQVHRWRLLGYENRAIADKDFRNDAVDAGELGSGHQVVALYEIERTMAAADAPLATVRLRWKEPYEAGMGKAALEAGEEASEVERAIFARGTSWEGTDAGYKRAVLVAQFAEILRRSSHARGDSLDALLRDLEPLARDGDADLRELFDLVRQSRDLILRSLPSCDELCLTIDEVRRWNLRQAELELLRVERDQKEIEDLARRNAELEQRIRELVRRRYEVK